MTMDTTGSDGIDGEADELVLKDEISGSDDESDSSSVQILDNDDNKEEESRNKKSRQKKSKRERLNMTASSMEAGELPFDSFMVDTEAVEDEAENSAFQPDDRGSSSRFSFAQVISHHTPVPKETKRNERNSGGKTCFNCGTVGHEVTKCPEPRDARRISQSRNLFGRRRESGSAALRFHEQRQGPQPGIVSDSLREALGIGLQELPPWIYRMRKLGLLNGYPPAYRNRATERLTVKFHMEEDVTSTVGHRRKRKHAEITGEDDQCQIKPEKLIRYPGFNYSDDNYADVMCQKKRDTHNWLIPPWDTFVQAQQHHVDIRRRQQKDEDEAAVVANKQKKVSAALDETEEISVLCEDEETAAEEGEICDEEEEETNGNATDEDDEGEEDGEDVLFVDASRTKKRKAAAGAADQSLEEGEIVDDESAEGEEDQDMDLRKHNNNGNRNKTKKGRMVAAVNVTMRREKKIIKTLERVCKRRRKNAEETAAASTAPGEVVPTQQPSSSSSTAAGTKKAAKPGDEATTAVVLLKQMQLGTPVPLSHHVCADKPDYAVEKPALEKWSIGIQAFQHQPAATSTGFFKRMHQIVKSVRKNGGDSADGDDKKAADEQQKQKR